MEEVYNDILKLYDKLEKELEDIEKARAITIDVPESWVIEEDVSE